MGRCITHFTIDDVNLGPTGQDIMEVMLRY